ncbi:Nuclear transport factor 2 [Coemansia sp. RSA 2399]|nr:Nuclear transport factor 2 [Coemansia sp. RSA 2399]KAJ1906779.1 Nuclear transport factor 2 [Coemansia sp. IMI 209127]
MSDLKAIGEQFVEFYYQTFDSNRSGLASLYRSVSMMTWEGSPYQGAESIVEKITSLPFQRVAHKTTTVDVQPSLPNVKSAVIVVTGQLLVDEETKPQQFTQMFQLVEDNGYFIYNDVFRLNYA